MGGDISGYGTFFASYQSYLATPNAARIQGTPASTRNIKILIPVATKSDPQQRERPVRV